MRSLSSLGIGWAGVFASFSRVVWRIQRPKSERRKTEKEKGKGKGKERSVAL
jgi:hypothetical protein